MEEIRKNCQCCYYEDCNKELYSEYTWLGQKEVYGEMLKDCFNIKVPYGFICEVCIARLRDSSIFKNQVSQTQLLFKNKPPSTVRTIEVKIEIKKESDVKSDHDDDNSPYNTDPDVPLSTIKEEIAEKKKIIKRKTRKVTIKKKDSNGLKSGTNNKSKGSSETEEQIKKKKIEEKIKNEAMHHNTITLLENSSICLFRSLSNSYMCVACKTIFTSINLLKEHTKSHNFNEILKKVKITDSKHYKVDISTAACNHCPKPVTTLTDLMSHLNKEHDLKFKMAESRLIPFRLDREFRCVLCPDSFKNFHKLNIHMNTHYQNYICDVCGAAFSNIVNLKRHINDLHVAKTFKCTKCRLDFVSSYRKELHDTKFHDKVPKRSCSFCSKRFHSHYSRFTHLIKEHGLEKPEYKCGSCDKVFVRKFLLNNHTRKHHMNERRHACSVCPVTFFSKYDLNQHMTCHTGEKNFMCTYCGKSYARKWNLRTHLKIHET